MSQMTGRQCPAPECNRTVPVGRYACYLDWRRLPAGLRTAILRAWGRRCAGTEGAAQEHEDAKATADAWFAGHPR